INIPIAAVTVYVAQRWVPESFDPDVTGHFDFLGAALAVAALAGTTYALIEWGSPSAGWVGAAGLAAAVAFVVTEARSPQRMMPLRLFADRTFSSANLTTLLVYAALGAVMFFLVLQLQTVGGYTPLQAGVSTLPIIVCMLLLAKRGGQLATRIGPRIP